jgi:hypothetical protein
LFTALLLLLLAAGCVDVDQHLTVRADGTISLAWKLGLRRQVADRTRKPTADEEWIREIEATGEPGQVGATVHRTDDKLWLELAGEFPDRAAYVMFRQRFVELQHEQGAHVQPWLFPPEIRSTTSGWRVLLEVQPGAMSPAVPRADDLADPWRLQVTLPEQPTAHTAHEVLDDGTLVWRGEVTEIMKTGIIASARMYPPDASTGWGWLLFPLMLGGAVVAGAGALWFTSADDDEPTQTTSG